MSYYSPFYQRWITKAWPKSAGKDTERRKYARLAFIDATQKIKNTAPELWDAAEEWTRNSPYLARDVLMASAMGTFSEITMADGTTKVSLRVTNRTIQQLLDSIGFQPGTILARTDVEWQALLPGNPGEVLTMNPGSNLPDWLPSSGGGGGAAEYWHGGTINSSFNGPSHAALGNMITTYADISVTRVAVLMTLVAGANYKLGIGPFDRATGKLTDNPTYFGDFTPATSLNGMLVTDGIAELNLLANQDYMAFVVRTDGSTTVAQSIGRYDDAVYSPAIWTPAASGYSAFYSNTVNPTPADTWTAYANNAHSIGVTYSFTP